MLNSSNRCSAEKVFLKFLQNWQENTSDRASFIIKLCDECFIDKWRNKSGVAINKLQFTEIENWKIEINK